jgi:UPF0042 nucleotide-binding protein
VIITGPAGAGRSTAIHALEDLGFETIDNIPLSLLPRLFEGDTPAHPVALGVDLRNRDFSTEALLRLIADLEARPGVEPQLVYLDCRTDVLLRRFSETRRRHPLSPDGSPRAGIRVEVDLLGRLRDAADILIDTSEMSPHELKAEIARLCALEEGAGLAVSVESFSYKRGIPQGADMVLDCRFLRNPHWEAALRPLDGRDVAVADFVDADPLFAPFMARVGEMLALLLPAYQAEGKAHFTIAFGCTGGRHRSVAVAEGVANALAADGWRVSKRHREMERHDAERAPLYQDEKP